jgi:hypothetical protein
VHTANNEKVHICGRIKVPLASATYTDWVSLLVMPSQLCEGIDILLGADWTKRKLDAAP